MQWTGGEKISHLTGTKQNDSKQTYLHISASTNLQYESLWQEIIKSIKKNMQNINKKYNEKDMCCFFTIWNLKGAVTYKYEQVVLSLPSVYFAISKLILLFSHSFHVSCIILSKVYFTRSMFPFLFSCITVESKCC